MGRESRMDTADAHFDVLIVGAGLSGIGAAVHLTRDCPGKSFAILEARSALGGTWDLFRYPGVRSDSDMYTLGYSFKPWTADKAIADADTILDYLEDTVVEHDLARHIRYETKLVSADWSSETARWTVDVKRGDGGTSRMTCSFLFCCTGYYSYEGGYRPSFAGEEDFTGTIVHPQSWPGALDHAGKRIVVIGSGATAVTLVPALAETAAHVTMLQRSPSYIASAPATDRFALWMRRVLPTRAAYAVTRWRNIAFQLFTFTLARRRPETVKKALFKQVREEMGEGVDMAHFTPAYNPWEERLCLVPDSDLFAALKGERADIVTDHVERFTATGVELRSGGHLDADIIVTATGLNLVTGGGASYSVDSAPVNFGERFNYKGVMFNDLPNFAMTFGYTNASWTLKADLTSEYICRLLNEMDRRGAVAAAPHLADPHAMEARPLVDFASGYIARAEGKLPKQGADKPWRLNQNYAKDILVLRHGQIDDGVMRFRTAAKAAPIGVAQKEPA